MQVEIVYALKKEQTLLSITVDEGSNIKQAIEKSEIMTKYPEIDLLKNTVGVFSKIAKLDDTLREKDRVEIYRPLIANPKEVRKRKALEGKDIGNKKNNDKKNN